MGTYTIGVDVGGTKIQAGLVGPNGVLRQSKQFLIGKKTKKNILKCMGTSIDYFFSNRVRAIGIGTTGLVNAEKGVVTRGHNLARDWHGVRLKQLLEKKYRVTVAIDNDVHASALAEATVGAGKKFRTVAVMAIGTGIGFGLVIDKRLYRTGCNTTELGHIAIAATSPWCSCGQRGHFEALASGTAMVKLYRKRTGKTLTSYEIVARARAGNRHANAILAAMAHDLGIGIANTLHLFSPDILVLTGGLSSIRPLIHPAIRSARKCLIYPELKKIPITVSELGYGTGVIGAALLTQHKVTA
ncbi:MAG: ROK family protein [Patescibacteria group bacterium]